jgi:hypothetical protein
LASDTEGSMSSATKPSKAWLSDVKDCDGAVCMLDCFDVFVSVNEVALP